MCCAEKLLDGLGLLLEDALHLDRVAVDQLVNEFGRVIGPATRRAMNGFGQRAQQGHGGQSIQCTLDGVLVCPFAIRQFGLDQFDTPDFREAGHRAVFVDLSQDFVGVKFIDRTGGFLDEYGEFICRRVGGHGLERRRQEIASGEGRYATFPTQ